MRKILLIFIFIIFTLPAAAAVFTVTSNADSGPGTLRQALLDAAANGSATQDQIVFNIADVSDAGRTITLLTALPDVTGNIIIDGTTQPGLKLGVSDAKITVTTAGLVSNMNAFNVSGSVKPTDAVEFYGLYIKDFGPNSLTYGKGIALLSNCKLVVGAAGKGNVICGVFTGVAGALQNAVIQSNFIGLAPDGVTERQNQSAIANSVDCDNLLIGGSAPRDGNVIVNSYYAAINIYHTAANTPMTINITNNLFGTDYTGTHIAGAGYAGGYIQANAYFTTLNVSKNVFTANGTAINALNQVTVNVQGNFFGVDRTGTIDLAPAAHNSQAISLNSYVRCVVGGNNPQDQNIFRNYNSVFFNINFSSLEVTKNSFKCNQFVGMQSYGGTNYTGNYLRVINLTDNYISGDAPAGAAVQLYFVTEVCNGYCNPDTWFATVTANNSGVWEYNGALPYHVMATSTYNHTTFGTEPYYVPESDVTVTDIDCHHLGSIEIKEKRSGKFTFTWKDGNKAVLPNTTQKLDNLNTPGTYYLEVSEDGSCPTAVGQFTVKDLRPHILAQTYTLDCNHQTVDMTVYQYNSYGAAIKSYHWLDKDGNEISTQSVYKSAGVGIYYVYITDANDCNSETVKYEVKPAPSPPVLDETGVIPADADCGTSNGSIKGLKTAAALPGLYGWVNTATGNTVYYQYDLVNAAPGTYHFFATYSTNCSVISKDYTIGTKNGITMDETAAAPTPVSCSGTGGGITGIKVTGATTYLWYNTSNPGNPRGNAVDFVATLPGSYYLVASNASGCSKTSKTYTVTGLTNTDNYGTGTSKVLTNATCGQNNGVIQVILQGTPTAQPASYRWVNHATGQTVGTTTLPTLGGLDAGTYDIFAANSAGCERMIATYGVTRTASFNIVTTGISHANDHCGLATGAITGITVSGAAGYTANWTDANGRTAGNNLDLKNVMAGSYLLTVTTADKSCSQTYGPVILTNTTTAGIDQTSAAIASTPCGQAAGSISNITVSGVAPFKYSWTNAQGTEVSTAKDLTGQPAGMYTLQVTDAGGCGPVYTTAIPIPEINNIVMDETGASPTQVSCSGTGGGISGIKVTGATIYKWYNSSGREVGSSIDLTGIAAGTYYLTAFTANNCSKTSKNYTVTQQTNTDVYRLAPAAMTNAECGLNNGSIQIKFDPQSAVPASYRWVNHTTGQTYNTAAPVLTNIDAGDYEIFAQNSSNCESPLARYTLYRSPALDVVTTNVRVTNDRCGSITGSITGVGATGLSPLTFSWTDNSGNPVGSNPDLINVPAGTYHLKIKDGSSCDAQTFDYTLVNKYEDLAAPNTKDLQLCGSGSALLTVPNISPGSTYRLYENISDTDPVDVQKSGVFKINAKANRSYYVSQSIGECESSKAEVKVTVGITASAIANTFSPNGDGVNDYWKIAGIESYPGAQVQVFTRTGQKIYESKGYVKPFDGTYQGKQLPVAAYYYIINLNSGCSLLSGSITLVR